MMNFVGIRKFF